MKHIIRKDIKNFLGLEYLTLKNAPVYDTQYGEVIDISAKDLELLAVETIIKNKIPLRGKEIHLFRSVLELSLDRFAREFDLSAGCVLKWERAENDYLSRSNQIMVLMYMAEKLNIDIGRRYSDLITGRVSNLECVA